jgi:hypothetical protein
MVEDAMKGEIDLAPFVTHTMGLDDINEAFDLMHEGRSIRTVITTDHRIPDDLPGALAWWFWKIIHLYFLIGTRNRLSVAISWVWNHSVAYWEPALSREPNLRSRVRRQPVLIQKADPQGTAETSAVSHGTTGPSFQQSVSGHTNAFSTGF